MRVWTVGFSLCLIALFCGDARAQSAQSSDPQAVQQELERLRQTVAALEARLAALEAKSGAAPAQAQAAGQPTGQPPAQPGQPAPAEAAAAPAPATAAVPSGAAGAGGPEGALPVYGNTAALSKIFNPDMAVIGDFVGAAGKNRSSTNDVTAPLALHEAETSFQAVVDPYARADFFISFTPEGVDVEEGYITFTSLPGGLLAKVGKMRGQFGKVNAMHNHVLPWADRPLVSNNLVGGEDGIDDSGVSVSRLIMNPLFFLEATGEVYRGDSNVFGSRKRSDLTYVGRLRGYRDISEGANLDLGTSIAYGHSASTTAEDGTITAFGPDATTRLVGVDATFRYRPLRRAIYRRFVGRTELIWSHREFGTPGPEETAGTFFGAPASAFGYYASGEYQFAQRWFAGARWDWSERAIDPSLKDKGGSLLLTYWPSEFSQVRGQFRHTSYGDGIIANEVLFQLLFSIGAHGAHTF